MSKKKPEIILKYTGAGWLPGVPARDLTQAEAEQYGGADYLISTGLYTPVEEIKQ